MHQDGARAQAERLPRELYGSFLFDFCKSEIFERKKSLEDKAEAQTEKDPDASEKGKA